MRLLYVTGGFPFPLTSGYLRHYFLLRELGARHEIVLLSIVPSDFEPARTGGVEPFVERVLTFRSPPRSRSVARRAIPSLRALVGARVDGPGVELARAAARLHAERPFDAAFFSGKTTAHGLRAFPPVPLVVDLCDASSSRVRGAMELAGGVRRALLAARHAEIRAIERRLIERAARVVVATARDRDELLATHGHPAVAAAALVPNGVDVSYWRRRSDALGEAVAFTGAMDYGPNVDAALELARRVMPLVWEARPDARLLLVGRDPTPEVRALAGARVTVTGTVDDVRPFLERAGVFAAPLRFGAGIQNKLLEALAMEVPVVASALAAAGVRADGDELPLEVADGPAAMAAAVLRRLERAAASPVPHREGRAFVERHFDWSRSAASVERLLEGCARAAGSDRAAAAGAGG